MPKQRLIVEDEAAAMDLQNLCARNDQIEQLITRSCRDSGKGEVLLRAINHYVKSNLQIAQCLLRMDAAASAQPGTTRIIDRAVQRVQVMAIAIDCLDAVSDRATANLSTLVAEVAASSIASNSADANGIVVRFDVDRIDIPRGRGLLLGLLVHELIAASVKSPHAGHVPQAISVSARTYLGTLRLIVEDASGIAPSTSSVAAASSEMEFAASLAVQLGGRIEFSATTAFRVEANLAHFAAVREELAPAVPSPQALPASWILHPVLRGVASMSAREGPDPCCYLS